VYLAELNIKDFRKIESVQLRFQPGLNILVGANNVGKTAVVDALRALLSGPDEYPLRLGVDDLRLPSVGEVAPGAITLHYVFRGLTPDDEADFLPAVKPGAHGALEAHITIRYAESDIGGRLRVRRWCGDHEDVGLSSDMLENLRGIYLPALRDASQGLKPSKTSQLARLLQLLADEDGRAGVDKALQELDTALKKHKPLVDTQSAITNRHGSMLGEQLAQELNVGLNGSDFQRMSARLSLLVDTLEIEQNGLGFNNLIYMAVVLSELAKNPEAAFRGLIVEEPEAHLHPQLQAVLLRYLEGIHVEHAGEKPVQVFVTSHSPNFASIAKLSCLACLVQTDSGVESFFPRDVTFAPGKREKLERYLDVTRAELFFARRVIFVEGAAELVLVPLLAQKIGYDLRRHAISVISVEGLNFDSFLPLFGEKALKTRVAVLTDADPEGKDLNVLYPGLEGAAVVSDNTVKMLGLQDGLVKVFHGKKTFEYDLALYSANRASMLEALKELHPKIGADLEAAVDAAGTNAEKARVLFSGMFERESNNVQKGRFGQTLAQVFSGAEANCEVPQYIRDAIEHVCVAKAVAK
jgi:putative ATP-dependent endonuclease of OLD family